MSSDAPISILVEGIIDDVVVRSLLSSIGLTPGIVYGGYQGKNHILKRLSKYNQAAAFSPWLVIIDLDQENNCIPDFLHKILPEPSKYMILRIAVHAIESWLLGDVEHLAGFLHVPKSKFPSQPDQEINPKTTLINLARESSRETIRKDMVPRPGQSVGQGYTGRLIEFVTAAGECWRPDVAMTRSDSLRRCVSALQSFKEWD